ncbi:hypothetical protein IE077_001458 [Cardiosporidium cionae]|uniref:Uncharacterized protein n=1 Tax=Cardiosporidium cionae TaxID=476202 RepID=A0ABQ7JCT8_9APIC|nr:hypothetical protein IE077_001458 [Cardiosporidium cionae]|eukprot:KAF8821858.1 hypothetical protein IE077_001458 [Cardiosporidium cionae]
MADLERSLNKSNDLRDQCEDINKSIPPHSIEKEEQNSPPIHGTGIKRKIRELEQMIHTELRASRKELQILKNRAEPQHNEEAQEKISQLKVNMVKDLCRAKEELLQYLVPQKQEYLQLHEELKTMRNETTALQHVLLSLQRRVNTIETEIGN